MIDGTWYASQITKNTESFFVFVFSVLFEFSYSHIACTHRSTHLHKIFLISESSTTKKRKMDHWGLIDCSRIISPSPPFPLSAVIHLFFSLLCDSKCEELAGLVQHLVNVYMSVGRRDGERSKDKSVGVGCYENRVITLLGGHWVGRAGKTIIAPLLKICWTLNQTAWCICRPVVTHLVWMWSPICYYLNWEHIGSLNQVSFPTFQSKWFNTEHLANFKFFSLDNCIVHTTYLR